ncbi:MAG: hypothetical protein HKN29_00540 [Rhodothermales bacterium]|nr:hypothetical protein [Rhodothermales bacterium]
MYAVDLSEAVEAAVAQPGEEVDQVMTPAMALIWENPETPALEREGPVLLLECRHRRHAYAVLRAMDEGFIREVRRGDRLVFQVYEGPEPVRLSLVPGIRTAA